MTGILLSPGPVSSFQVIRNMSRTFRSSVNKSKFLVAANRLASASLGSIVQVLNGHVFVKRIPQDMDVYLQRQENQDLCTSQEFKCRFGLPTPKVIGGQARERLIHMGLVLPQHFTKEQKMGDTIVIQAPDT